MTAAAIAAAVIGTVLGDGAVVVDGVAPLHRAGHRDVSFFASLAYAKEFAQSAAGIVSVSCQAVLPLLGFLRQHGVLPS